MQHRLFGGAIQVLLETHARYNVLNSVILELFDFIHRNNRHKLQKHIAQYHREELQGIDYVPTFQIILSMGADEPSSSLSADMSENSLKYEFFFFFFFFLFFIFFLGGFVEDV